MNIISTLTAGDSANWTDDPWVAPQSKQRLTSADWTLTYQLRGPSPLSLTAVADGDGWRTSIATTDSGDLAPGTYVWASYLSKDGERLTTGTGSLIITADLALMATPFDARTLAERALADCETALASYSKTKKYMIGSRQAEYYDPAQLMVLRDFWQKRVNKERAQAAVANGRTNPRRLLVRFG